MNTVNDNKKNSNLPISDVSKSKIILNKKDVLGNTIETIELDGRWEIITNNKSYFMTSNFIDEIKIDIEKLQKHFLDNV